MRSGIQTILSDGLGKLSFGLIPLFFPQAVHSGMLSAKLSNAQPREDYGKQYYDQACFQPIFMSRKTTNFVRIKP